MDLGLHILKNPAGTYSFVGNVPICLAYERKNGEDISPFEADKLLHSNYPEFIKKRYNLQVKTFENKQDALNLAERLGYTVIKD